MHITEVRRQTKSKPRPQRPEPLGQFRVGQLARILAIALLLVATVGGGVADAVRVRKNQKNLTAQEKQDYVDALLAVKAANDIDNSIIPWHQSASNMGWAHGSFSQGTTTFLPWHREYLRRFEDLLRAYKPNVTIPYWDSSDLTSNPFQVGFGGGLGDPTAATIVASCNSYPTDPAAPVPATSAFGSTATYKINVADIFGQMRLYRRKVLGGLPNATVVANAITVPATFLAFYTAIEKTATNNIYIHGSPHVAVGGHMGCIPSAPNDPVFWMHHAWIDRLWCKWQEAHTKTPQFTNTLDPAKGIDVKMEPWNTLDTFSARTPRQLVTLADEGVQYDDCVGARCVSRPSGMVAWWANCDVRDISGNGNHATLLKQSTCPTDSKVGGQALRFVAALGEYDQVPSSNSLNFGPGPLSIDAWVKTSNATGTRVIVDKRNASSVGYALYLTNGKPGAVIGDGSFSTQADTTTNVANGQWHHVTVTIARGSATGIKFYIDGNQFLPAFSSTSTTGSITNTNVLRIGSASAGAPASFFDGLLDEIEIFNRALTADEVSSIYLADTRGKCKPFIWPPPPIDKCPKTVIDGGGKLVDAIGKTVSKCHSARIKGSIPSTVDCNIISIDSDPKGSVAKVEQKLRDKVAKICDPQGFGSPGSYNYDECPEPCDVSVPIIQTFADVSNCEICLARYDAEQMSTRVLGSPTSPPTLAAKCHDALAKNQAKYVKSVIKAYAKCRKLNEITATPPPYVCDPTPFQQALTKATSGLDKKCSALNPADLASFGAACSAVSYSAFRTCVLADWTAHANKLFHNLDVLDGALLCGNGVIDAGEQCDDAGETASCDSDCTLPACGDGHLNPNAGEVCDDGNMTIGDGCDTSCQEENYCNCVGGETMHSCTLTSTATEFCHFGSTCVCPFCGDGTVDLGEVCDTAGDSASCDADCTLPACGDGHLNVAAGEACDDGNTQDGDGCTSSCQTACFGGSNDGALCTTASECPGGTCG